MAFIKQRRSQLPTSVPNRCYVLFDMFVTWELLSRGNLAVPDVVHNTYVKYNRLEPRSASSSYPIFTCKIQTSQVLFELTLSTMQKSKFQLFKLFKFYRDSPATCGSSCSVLLFMICADIYRLSTLLPHLTYCTAAFSITSGPQ